MSKLSRGEFEGLKAALREESSPGVKWPQITEKFRVSTEQLRAVYYAKTYEDYAPVEPEPEHANDLGGYSKKVLENGTVQYRQNGRLVAVAKIPAEILSRL